MVFMGSTHLERLFDDDAERGRIPFRNAQLEMIVHTVRRDIDMLVQRLVSEIEIESDPAPPLGKPLGQLDEIPPPEQNRRIIVESMAVRTAVELCGVNRHAARPQAVNGSFDEFETVLDRSEMFERAGRPAEIEAAAKISIDGRHVHEAEIDQT